MPAAGQPGPGRSSEATPEESGSRITDRLGAGFSVSCGRLTRGLCRFRFVTMTLRERLVTAMRREVPDRVPAELWFTPALADLFKQKTGADDPYEYWGFEERTISFRSPAVKADYSPYYPERLPSGSEIDDFGKAQVPANYFHFTGLVHPLRRARTLKEIEQYPLPEYSRPECWQHLLPEVETLHERGIAAHGLMGCTIFEVSWGIRSMEELLMDIMTQPEFARVLLDRITELRVFQAGAFARAGVDILRTGDDIGSQKGMIMSPGVWREWFKPRLARVIDAAREVKPDILIWYHSDGDCSAVIPELIEIGIDILNPVQPECLDPADIKRQYGDRLSFSGTIGTQSTMPFGTPQEVESTIKKRIETVGVGGGLLLAPTHVLEPDVPWENILAFIEAVDRYGWYR